MIQVGPGAKMQGDLSVVLEALLKIIQNNNEQQSTSFELQAKAAEGQSKAIIDSAKEQADATRLAGQGEWVGAVTGGATTIGGQGAAMKLQNSVGEMKGQLEGIDALRGKLATNVSPSIVEGKQGPAPTSTAPEGHAKTFLEGNARESAAVFSKGTATPEEYDQRLQDIAAQSQGDPAQALKKADQLHDEIKTQRDHKSREADRVSTSTQAIGQSLNGLLRGMLTANSAEYQEKQGEQEAIKMIYALLVEFAKGIKDTTTSQIQTSQQQMASALQLLDASVYQASHQRA